LEGRTFYHICDRRLNESGAVKQDAVVFFKSTLSLHVLPYSLMRMRLGYVTLLQRECQLGLTAPGGLTLGAAPKCHLKTTN